MPAATGGKPNDTKYNRKSTVSYSNLLACSPKICPAFCTNGAATSRPDNPLDQEAAIIPTCQNLGW